MQPHSSPHSLLTLSSLSLIAMLAGCMAPPAPFDREELAGTTAKLDDEGGTDADNDGTPDKLDCDPQSSNLGKRYVEDDLATAKGAIEAAPGFSKTSWAHADGGWTQTVVQEEGNASLFTGVNTDGDLLVEATARVTKVRDDILRQTFVIVGAPAPASSTSTSTNPPTPDTGRTTFKTTNSTDTGTGNFSAYGCGIELVDGFPEASLVQLTGNAGGVIKTKVLKSDDRDSVELGEAFDISVKVAANTITCTIKQQRSTTTLVAVDVGTVRGGVGFFTREAGARFNAARVCKVNR